VNMTRVAHRATRCALSGTARYPVDNPSSCGSSLIAYEILSKQPEPPLITIKSEGFDQHTPLDLDPRSLILIDTETSSG
ncbi:MAG TPA: hypothetical protein VJK02_20400, partial [Anaerolineales bacterium]|nr:hypothetical protein [Anaerolineales bacterium]